MRVNTYTTGDQSSPAVTALRDGSFVVTWKGAGDRTAIALRRHGPDASPAGPQLPLVAEQPSQRIPGEGAIAGLTGGGFLAVWAATRLASGGHHLYGRVFDASGVPISRRFKVAKQDLPPIRTYQVEAGLIEAAAGGGWRRKRPFTGPDTRHTGL